MFAMASSFFPESEKIKPHLVHQKPRGILALHNFDFSILSKFYNLSYVLFCFQVEFYAFNFLKFIFCTCVIIYVPSTPLAYNTTTTATKF